ncbi:hypothetical protein [Natrinema gelatinilyticum]|nr:hypothetical protein [Natrinema gelatinilyticum]
MGIQKEPDIYERGLYLCLGSFHAHGSDVTANGEAAADAKTAQD